MTKASAVRATLAILAVAAAVAAAALLWLTPWETQEAHGQHVALACEKMAAQTYFDVEGTSHTKFSDGTPDVYASAIIRVAGPDMHVAEKGGDGMGVEGIYLDGVGYARLGGGPWAVNKSFDGSYVTRNFGLRRTPEGVSLCPEFAASIEKVGEVVLDGVPTTHYRSWHDLKGIYPNYNSGTTINYWVDSTDLLVQTSEVRTTTPKAGKDLPSYVQTVMAKVVGVGEVNVITAPVVSGQ